MSVFYSDAFMSNLTTLVDACKAPGDFPVGEVALINLGLDALIPEPNLNHQEEPNWAALILYPTGKKKPGTFNTGTIWDASNAKERRGRRRAKLVITHAKLKELIKEHVGSYDRLSEKTGIAPGTIRSMLNLRTRGRAYERITEYMREQGYLTSTPG